jgi:hypothetical protein
LEEERIIMVRVSVMVFNATFNNISVIAWRSVLPSCKNYYELNGKQFYKCDKYLTCDHDQNLRVVDALLWSS